VLGWAKASLAEAEAFGFEHPEAMEGWAQGAPAAAAAAAGGDAAVEPKALATAATKYIDQYKAQGGTVQGAGKRGGEPYNPEEAGQLVEIHFSAPQK
jgi:hypothetical protein